MVTVTTVGYGDATPISPLGKVVAGLTMFCGILSLAFPMVIFSQNFQSVQEEFEQRRRGRERALVRKRKRRTAQNETENQINSQDGEEGEEMMDLENTEVEISPDDQDLQLRAKRLPTEQLHDLVKRELKSVSLEVEVFEELCERVEQRIEFIASLLTEIERRELSSRRTHPKRLTQSGHASPDANPDDILP